MQDEHEQGRGTDDEWDGEPESLYASTAPFCESALHWVRVDGVSLALLSASPNVRELVFAAGAVAARVDELQFAVGDGPCLTAYATGRPQCITDLSRDDRWPEFAREALGYGVNAVFSFPVLVDAHPVAVLELYRRDVGGLTVDEYDAALGCAAGIGAVMTSVYHRWSRRDSGTALTDGAALAGLTESDPFTRVHQLHDAAGIIAERLGVSVSEALVRMRAYAFARDLSVSEVADDVVKRIITFTDQDD